MSAQFVWPLRVYSEDTDSFGIVHHSQYLKYMERARLEWLVSMGHELGEWAKQGILFVVQKAELDYISPAHAYDNIEVVSSITKTRRACLEYLHESRAAGTPEKIYCRAHIRVVCINEAMRPRVLPEALLGGMKIT